MFDPDGERRTIETEGHIKGDLLLWVKADNGEVEGDGADTPQRRRNMTAEYVVQYERFSYGTLKEHCNDNERFGDFLVNKDDNHDEPISIRFRSHSFAGTLRTQLL